ncbi:MAG: MotA/TolQ/ExbB proton channel family protein [Succinivibrionaceae bacterium]
MVEHIYSLIGPIGCIIVFLAFIGLYLAIFSVIYSKLIWIQYSSLKNKKSIAEFRHIISLYKNNNPLLKTLNKALENFNNKNIKEQKTELNYLFYNNFYFLITRNSIIKTIAVISPLLGLLGTVVGILQVFINISNVSQIEPQLLANGIWQALITTVLGIIVAVPLIVSHQINNNSIKKFHIEITGISNRI